MQQQPQAPNGQTPDLQKENEILRQQLESLSSALLNLCEQKHIALENCPQIPSPLRSILLNRCKGDPYSPPKKQEKENSPIPYEAESPPRKSKSVTSSVNSVSQIQIKYAKML